MTEAKEKKKKASAAMAIVANATASAANALPENSGTSTSPKEMKSGEMLRAARLERKLSLEEISSSIHIRVAQLRALEEGQLDALPGMTYAIGFVRSYANYLKINSTDVVAKFKAENGALKAQMPDLHIPEPIPENRMPDPMVMGVAAFCALLLLIGWTFFSGGSETATELAEEIPQAPAAVAVAATAPAPAVLTATPAQLATTAPAVVTQPQTVTQATPATTAEGAPVAAAPAATLTDDMAASTQPLATATAGVDPSVASDNGTSLVTTVYAPTTSGVAPVAPTDAQAIISTQDVVPVQRPILSPEMDIKQQQAAQEIINVKPIKSRVTIRATSASWVQINNAQKKPILKRLLKPGEQFMVPDEPGMSLVTTNAGGIELYVDGRKTKALGKRGDILNGVSLDAGRITQQPPQAQPRVYTNNLNN